MTLTIRLTKSGRALLRARPGGLKVKVTGSASQRATTTLGATLKTRR